MILHHALRYLLLSETAERSSVQDAAREAFHCVQDAEFVHITAILDVIPSTRPQYFCLVYLFCLRLYFPVYPDCTLLSQASGVGTRSRDIAASEVVDCSR